MKDFDALKDIWHAQVALPKVSHQDVLKQVSKTKKEYANKLLREVVMMGFAIATIAYIWMVAPFRMETTHLAMALIIICCLLYLFFQIKDYRNISDNALLLNKPEDYLNYLKTYKHQRYIFNTKTYTLFTMLLGVAFLLYFIEISFLAPLWITALGVTVTAAWFLFCYYIIMRNYIRKESAKLQEMIENLERLQRQFK